MLCENVKQKLYEFVFDLLNEDEKSEVAKHLASCAECRREHESALGERDLLKEWSPAAAPTGLADETIRAAGASPSHDEAAPREPIEPQMSWLGSRRFWAAAAAGFVLFVGGIVIQSVRMSLKEAGPQEAFVYGQSHLTPSLPVAYRVFVRNGVTAEPIPGADVSVMLVSSAGDTVWSTRAVTGDDGIVHVEPDLPDDLDEGGYTLKVIAESDAGRSEISRNITVKRSFKVMVSTDKPLYQPGQVIHIRTLALATADLRPVSGRDITIEVQDAKGNKVFKKRADTSAYGIASADFTLADQVNTGSYTITATIGDTTSERSVQVKRYRLPKFKIDLATDKGFYEPGEMLVGDISVQYTFGKPVAGGKVHIEAEEFIEKFRTFATVEGETDADGKFHFEIPLKDHFVGQELRKGDAFVTLTATVTDKADHTQKKTRDVTITDQAIRIEVFPESGTLVQNVENILYIVTAYPDGRPARTKLVIGATRRTAETSASGIAKVKITPTKPVLNLTIAAVDDKGVRATVTRKLRIGKRSDSFLLRTERAVYRTGETVNITILSADRRGRIFLDVVKDRRTMLMRAIDIRDGAGALALDLPGDLFGTLEFHAYRIMSDGNIVSDAKVIQVNRADDLKIAVELDKTEYRPAEKALLKFIVSGADGKGVQAAISLAGVDEAVFALAEMQPGLARIYFTLQEEILKPRFELCTHPPISPADTVELDAEEEASVVLFSAAEGSGDPPRSASSTFAAKQRTVQREKGNWFRSLAAAVAVAPFVLFVLLALPVNIYAWYKLFRRSTLTDVPPEDMHALRRATRKLFLWWIAGVWLPPTASFFVGRAVYLSLSDGLRQLAAPAAAVITGASVLVVFVMLIRSVRQVRRCRAAAALPFLKKVIRLLPFAYVVAVAAAVCLVAASDTYPRVLRRETAAVLLAVIAGIVLFVVAAISVARNCAIRRVSVKRWFWLAISRPVLVATIAGLVIVPLLMPAGRKFSYSVRDLTGSVPMVSPGGGFIWEVGETAQEGFGGGGGGFFDVAAGEGGGGFFSEAEPMAAEALETYSEELVEGFGPGLETGEKAAKPLKAPKRIRRFFPETLLWRPEVITDAEGRAQLEVPLADSITTWRIAATAVSQKGELGSATKPLRVFQDFFVDIDFPVALTQHDLVSVPIAVYNYLDKPQKVRLEVQRAGWFKLLDEPTRTINVGPREVTGVYFRIEAVKPGRHTLTLKAFGSEMADAVERNVIVEPDGKAFVETINGQLKENKIHQIIIPEGAIDGANDLLVKIYPGAFSQVVEGLDNIFQMPFGCFEQASSVTYPNVLVLDYMQRTKQAKPQVEMKALNYINLGYQRLLSFEVDGGGFDWYGNPPADTVLTAYGLMEFEDMAKVYDIDPAVIQRTRKWLYSKQQDDGSWKRTGEGGGFFAEVSVEEALIEEPCTTAYVAWALAEAGKADKQLHRALDYVTRSARETEDPYTLALCANALIAAKRSEANVILGRLDAMKQSKGELIWWESSSQGIMYSRGDCLNIETTALAAYASLKAGRRVDVAHKALAWLVEQKDPQGTWYSTQATVLAMKALLAGTGPSSSIESTLNVTITVNGKAVKEIVVTPETSDVFRLVSLRALVRKGQNIVALEVSGKGDLAYQIVATHYLPWPADEVEPLKPLTIDLKYNTTMLKKDDILSCEVTIRNNSPEAASMTIVDLGIPPGFEVLPDAFNALKKQEVIEQWSMTGRQIILYFRSVPARKPITFTYRMRAKFPVKAKTPRSVIYKYYEPEVRDEAAPVLLTVL